MTEVAATVAGVLGNEDIFVMPEVYMLDKKIDPEITADNIVRAAKANGEKCLFP